MFRGCGKRTMLTAFKRHVEKKHLHKGEIFQRQYYLLMRMLPPGEPIPDPSQDEGDDEDDTVENGAKQVPASPKKTYSSTIYESGNNELSTPSQPVVTCAVVYDDVGENGRPSSSAWYEATHLRSTGSFDIEGDQEVVLAQAREGQDQGELRPSNLENQGTSNEPSSEEELREFEADASVANSGIYAHDSGIDTNVALNSEGEARSLQIENEAKGNVDQETTKRGRAHECSSNISKKHKVTPSPATGAQALWTENSSALGSNETPANGSLEATTAITKAALNCMSKEAVTPSYTLTITKPSREGINAQIFAKLLSLPKDGVYDVSASSMSVDEAGGLTLRAVRKDGTVEIHRATGE